jgi:hypothetical protein
MAAGFNLRNLRPFVYQPGNMPGNEPSHGFHTAKMPVSRRTRTRIRAWKRGHFAQFGLHVSETVLELL